MTRLKIIKSILQERKADGLSGFDIRGLAIEAENRLGKFIMEDTVRKEADLLKPEIPFVKGGKGIRIFV